MFQFLVMGPVMLAQLLAYLEALGLQGLRQANQRKRCQPLQQLTRPWRHCYQNQVSALILLLVIMWLICLKCEFVISETYIGFGLSKHIATMGGGRDGSCLPLPNFFCPQNLTNTPFNGYCFTICIVMLAAAWQICVFVPQNSLAPQNVAGYMPGSEKL